MEFLANYEHFYNSFNLTLIDRLLQIVTGAQNVSVGDKVPCALDGAELPGGTTIKSYTSSEGVHGRFQSHLLVHTKDKCPICQEKIEKIEL